MYRAIYDYTSNLKNYLSFKKDDDFTVITDSEKDWFLVKNALGETGYVPKNYVESIPVSNAHTDVVTSIDRAIAAIQHQAACSRGIYTPEAKENLAKLVQHRKEVLHKENSLLTSEQDTVKDQSSSAQPSQNLPKRRAPEPPDSNKQVVNRSVKRTTAPYPPNRTSSLKDISSHESLTSNTQGQLNSPTSYSAQSETETFDTDTDSVMSSPSVNNQVISSQPDIADERTVTRDKSPDLQNVVTINPIFRIDTATSPITSPSMKYQSNTSMIDVSRINIPKNIERELIEEVRTTTELSYEKSRLAVECIFSHLKARIPETSDLFDKISQTAQESSNEADDEKSNDSVRLQELFSELAACKDDSQQRSWALHEDESVITGYLENLNSILENAKASVCRRVIARNNFECLNNLVVYYQMEVRPSLRLLMLKSFAAVCSLDKLAISQLLFSVLPLELATEMKSCKDDVNHLTFVTLVLTMIFSTGETVHVSVYEHLNRGFIQFVFELLETPPSEEHENKVGDLLVNFLLAFNLHFPTYEDNLVMPVLAERGIAEIFCEKILILANRGEDPVQIFDHQPQPPNSVMKLFLDLYSNQATSCLFYTNDLKVLIDIIIRHLCDLCAGDKKRTLYLSLIQLILRNSDYSDSQYRKQELTECFTNIITEESETELDKSIANDIMEEKKDLLFYS